MDTLSAIQERRSVKHFDSQHRMTEAEEKALLDLAILSPTAFNIQHWRFLNVKNPEIRQKIKELSWGQAQVTDASLLIVICADIKAWEKRPERYWANAPKEVQDYLVPAIGKYYSQNEQAQRDECMRSCGMAAQTLMLAAKGMGYDSCPMDGFDFEKVAEVIKLPQDHLISMFVVIGKAAMPARPRPGQLPLAEVLKIDTF